MESDVASKFVEYTFRKVQVLKMALTTAVPQKEWRALIGMACSEALRMRVYGSRFVAFHLARILNEERETGCPVHIPVSQNEIRELFKAVCDGSKPKLTPQLQSSLKIWNESIFPSDGKRPSVVGLNTVSTTVADQYYVNFKNYHLIGLMAHYTRFLKEKYNISRSKAKCIAEHVFQNLKIRMPSDKKDLSETSFKPDNTLRDLIQQEMLDSRKWTTHALSPAGRVRMHYEIIHEMKKKETGIAPLCGYSLPFVQFCKKTLRELKALAVNENIAFTVDGASDLTCPALLTDILSHKAMRTRRTDQCYMPAFRSDGVTINLAWSENYTIKKAVTCEEFQKKADSQKKYLQEKVKKKDAKLHAWIQKNQQKLKVKMEKREARLRANLKKKQLKSKCKKIRKSRRQPLARRM